MAARNVPIVIDEKLLARIDRDPEAKKDGRSAFIQRAVTAYLELKRRKEVDAAYERGYGGKADEVFDEFSELIASRSSQAR